MGVVSKGLVVASVMFMGGIAATGIVAVQLEQSAWLPIDRNYSPTADMRVDEWGLPLSTAAGRQDDRGAQEFADPACEEAS